MELVLGILLTVTTAWFLLFPHLSEASFDADLASETSNSLQDQKARCLQVLKDLELDYSTGKVSEEDYKSTRHSLSVELAQILERLGE